jgi:glycosyltransferase involved in cell wall biosynthesis
MKKLAYIITQSEMGGAQKSILILCEQLSKEYDITVYSAPEGGLVDELRAINVQHVPVPDMVREINPIKDFKAYRFLIKEFRENKFDIVHCHSSKAGIIGRQAAKKAGIKKILYTAHGFVFNEPMSSIKKQIYTILEKLSATITNTIICVDPKDIKIAKKLGITPKDGFAYIPNGIAFDAAPWQSCFKSENAEAAFTFGFVANFYETKGHRYLIEAFNKLTVEVKVPMRLVLVGDGILRAEMETLAENNENIIFTGYRKDAQELMKGFDCFIMSSVKEGFPFVILEAIKNKLPVISTDVGAVSEILNGGALGWLVPPFNSEGLKAAMLQVMNDMPLARQKAEKAYAQCKQHYSIENMAALTRQVYLETGSATTKGRLNK